MIPIQIRPATIHDAAQLSTLATTVFAETYQAMIEAETLQKYLKEEFSVEALRLELTDLSSDYLVACHNERLIGFSKLSPTTSPHPDPLPTIFDDDVMREGENEQSTLRSTKAIEMVKLYVAKSYLGFGVGAQLMKGSISIARALGYDRIWLCVWEKNERAIAFYRKWGFEKVGTMEIFVGDVVFDDLVLERGL